MLKKLTGLSIGIVVLFFGIAGAQGQIDAQALYWNLSLQQLGVPNPLNEPYYFSSTNAPTQTWHTNAGNMQASVGYLGLFSLTNTEAVMQNLDVILQNTRIESSNSTFDPVFGMRYRTSAVNAAISANTLSPPVSATLSGAGTINIPQNVNAVANTVVSTGTSGINAGGTLCASPSTLGLTKNGAGTLTLSGGSCTFTGATIDCGAATTFSGAYQGSNASLNLNGNGQITQVENGSLTLAGNMTYTGITIGHGSILNIGSLASSDTGGIIGTGSSLSAVSFVSLSSSAFVQDTITIGESPSSVVAIYGVPEPSAFLLLIGATIAGLLVNRIRRKS